jgi:hypothetical protein
VYHHRLSDDDDLEDVALDVERYLNKDWKRDPGKHVSPPGASSDRGATLERRIDRMANVDERMEDPGSPSTLSPNTGSSGYGVLGHSYHKEE